MTVAELRQSNGRRARLTTAWTDGADAAWHKACVRLESERKLRGIRFGRDRRAAE